MHTPHLKGFIVYLAPCSRLYQLNLLNSYCGCIYNAIAVVSNSVPGNRSQSLFVVTATEKDGKIHDIMAL